MNGFPADSVLYALHTMHVNPDLLVSGINDGQNIGPAIPLSGTIGAARVGGRESIPAVAVSQGFGSPPDFPSGVTALLDWFDQFLLGRAGPPLFESVVNINIPTCTTGSIRGTVHVPAATAFNGRPFNPSNCLSSASRTPRMTSTASSTAGLPSRASVPDSRSPPAVVVVSRGSVSATPRR